MRLRFWKKEEPEEALEEEQKTDIDELKDREAHQEGPAGIWADLTRLRAKLDSLDEIRKASAERFAHMGEQIGELRGMILDTNRSVSEIELKVTKTVDLVEAVQPDKLMVEVRKTDGKVEALRANIESNESMMKTIMAQLKELRSKIGFFRGLEQVMKLNEDVKKELTQIQKTKAVIERHADKTETLFSEMQNRFSELDQYTGKLKDLTNTTKQLTDATDILKVQIVKRAEKKELERLIKKFDEFEVHVGNVIDLLSRKSKDLSEQFKGNIKKFQNMFNLELQKGKKVVDLIESLSRDNPNLHENLGALKEIETQEQEEEELKKIAVTVQGEKKGWFSWMKKKPKQSEEQAAEAEKGSKEEGEPTQEEKTE